MGFAGRTGAGKTCAANHLSSHYGFQYARYSDVLQNWLSPSDGADRDQLRALGWEVMASGRQRELNAHLIAALDRSRSAVIDGIRHPTDLESLSSAFGSSFRLIFLEARSEIRFARLRSRFSSKEAFDAAESAPAEGHIDDLKSSASTTITSEGPVTDLYRDLDAWVSARENGNPI